MNNYKIVTDIGSDLTNIDGIVLPMDLTINEKQYLYGPNGSISLEEFYSLFSQHKHAITSQIPPNKFFDAVEPIVNSGFDVIYLSLSSGLSGTFNSSLVASRELNETYPDVKITCIDTKLASTAFSCLVLEAISHMKSGMLYDHLVDWINSKIGNIHNIFIVDDLNTLKRGGRINNMTSIAGTLLNIKPVLRINYEGKIELINKVRGRNGSINEMYDFYKKHYNTTNDSTIYIGHANNIELAYKLRKLILTSDSSTKVRVLEIGPIIASHSGENTLMIAFL